MGNSYFSFQEKVEYQEKLDTAIFMAHNFLEETKGDFVVIKEFIERTNFYLMLKLRTSRVHPAIFSKSIKAMGYKYVRRPEFLGLRGVQLSTVKNSLMEVNNVQS